MQSFSDALSAAGDAQLVLVSGAPRTGIAALAGQLAEHPDALLVDGVHTQALVWLSCLIDEPDLLQSLQLKMEPELREINGTIPAQAPTHLILPVQGLIEDKKLQHRLMASSLTGRTRLILTQRDYKDTLASLARFPHLQPDLPDAHHHQGAYLAAADQLLTKAMSQANQLQGQWSSAGLAWLMVDFEALVSNPDVRLSQLRKQLGLRVLKSEERPRKRTGISLSVCCRERKIDASSVGRWQRQLDSTMASTEIVTRSVPVIPGEPNQSPVILTGRGGSGTRLLAEVCLGFGLHLGDSLNSSLDSLQWVDLLYEAVLTNLASQPKPWRGTWAAELRNRARWHRSGHTQLDQPWGFKLPEAMLVGHELMEAWPGAQLVHLVRHPLDVCLRRTHMTSRTTNPIGRATLREAYQALGRDGDPQIDPPHWRNAVSWWFQLSRMQSYKHQYGHRILEVRYEDLCDHTTATAFKLARDLNLQAVSIKLQVDAKRRRRWEPDDPRIAEIWDLCGPMASLYGYALES